MSVLSVSGLSVHAGSSALVDDVSFALEPGERVGLIGESGSGKSMTALAVMGLLPEGLRASGKVALTDGSSNLLTLREHELSRLRGSQLSMVFQEPMSALNPTMRVGDQLAEVLRIHGASRQAASARSVELLAQVRLPDPSGAVRAYPHQLSGGQRQRVMIAMALANDPLVLICDEPTSALDVTVQSKILSLIVEATADLDTSLLFITHDLPVVATVCDRVLVMREGAVVESGPVESVFTSPSHSYTRLLLDAATLGRPSQASRPPHEPIVDASGVSRTFRRARRSLFGPRPEIRALRDVRLSIAAGQRFGVVGESGSGKSTLVRLIAGLDKPTEGAIRFAGRRIEALPERRLRFLREDLQMVFQDPAGSLDPRMRVRDIVAEPLVSLQKPSARDVDERVAELLSAVGLPLDAADRYPHQFSGGQRQRISIARALAPRPRVLVADEPVSALDAPIRAQILDLLAKLVDEYELTMVFVSHDLTVVRQVCDMVAVLRDGELVELGPTEQVYSDPQHPYTRELLAAVPTLEKALAAKGVR